MHEPTTNDVPYKPEEIVPANGIEIAYDAFGRPDNPPLLLIMGLGAQMIGWDEALCARLAAQGFYVIRFDNRDVGHSTWFDAAGLPDLNALVAAFIAGRVVDVKAAYTLADMADDAAALLDALGIAQAHVVGTSMGGMIAQWLALRHPERVRTLVCMSTMSGNPDLPPPTSEAITALLAPASPGREGYIAQSVRTSRLLQGTRWPFEEARARRRAAATYDRGAHPAGTVRQLAAIAASIGWHVQLPAVTTPALVIHGQADPLIRVEGGMDLAERLPNAQLQIIPAAGHTWPPSSWPELIELIVGHAGERRD